MASQITNKSSGLILVRLRSGATLHLAAGEKSPELEDADVRDNPRLESLLQRNLIAVEELTPADKPSGSAAKRSRSGSSASASRDEEGGSQ